MPAQELVRHSRLADLVRALVASRQRVPRSGHGMVRWLETDLVCDRQGRWPRPVWREDAEPRSWPKRFVRRGVEECRERPHLNAFFRAQALVT